jgi:hypothetical protein
MQASRQFSNAVDRPCDQQSPTFLPKRFIESDRLRLDCCGLMTKFREISLTVAANRAGNLLFGHTYFSSHSELPRQLAYEP